MKKIIIANWKMNSNKSDSLALVSAIKEVDDLDLVLCPPITMIDSINTKFLPRKFKIGAQNVSAQAEVKGAYTGEISASMLQDIGCEYCIVGHSERRNIFKETSEDVRKKASFLHAQPIKSIICVGEKYEDRIEGKQYSIIAQQLLASIPETANRDNTIIAYEPVWAIGTGRSATVDDITEVVSHIENVTKEIERVFKIVYGGSVSAENTKDILTIKSLDGLLVGGAGLDYSHFNNIVDIARHV